MAYFLKKCSKNGKCYLSIVNSFYDGERGHTVHETYASYGTGSSLLAEGISDPVKYLEDMVAQLNFEKNQSKSSVLIFGLRVLVFESLQLCALFGKIKNM